MDPVTGFPIDPFTGYPINPSTGEFLDPATGLPIDPALIPPPQFDPMTGMIIPAVPLYAAYDPMNPGPMLPPPPPPPMVEEIDITVPAEFVVVDKNKITINVNTCTLPVANYGPCGPLALVMQFDGMHKTKYKASSIETSSFEPNLEIERKTTVRSNTSKNALHLYGLNYGASDGSFWNLKTTVEAVTDND